MYCEDEWIARLALAQAHVHQRVSDVWQSKLAREANAWLAWRRRVQ